MFADIAMDHRGRLFFWNLHGAVGLNGVNKFDDVMFVQWCLYKMAKWERIPVDLRAELARTPVSGECTGREGDMTIASIKALQRSKIVVEAQGLLDGRVSPAKGNGHYSNQGGSPVYLIFYLNYTLRALYPQQYPRIDLMPEFIWRIRAQAIDPFS